MTVFSTLEIAVCYLDGRFAMMKRAANAAFEMPRDGIRISYGLQNIPYYCERFEFIYNIQV